MPEPKVLLILSHPNYSSSFANKTIISFLKQLLPSLEIDHIDSLYPSEKIDIKKEQEKLLKNDYIIFQYPMFWHNRPHLLSKWFEDVYEYGFAYGNNSYKLKDKKIIVSITLGNTLDFFKDDISLDNLLSPFKASAKYTKQIFFGYVMTDNISNDINNNTILKQEKIKELEKHAQKIYEIIQGNYLSKYIEI